MKPFWDGSVIGWNRFWMIVSVDEIVFGWKCILPRRRVRSLVVTRPVIVLVCSFRVFSAVSYPSRCRAPQAAPHQHIASPSNWRCRFVEHHVHNCHRVALLALSDSLIPTVSALSLVSASCGFVAAWFLRSIHGIRRCIRWPNSSNAENASLSRTLWRTADSGTLSLGASSMLIFRLTRSFHHRTTSCLLLSTVARLHRVCHLTVALQCFPFWTTILVPTCSPQASPAADSI